MNGDKSISRRTFLKGLAGGGALLLGGKLLLGSSSYRDVTNSMRSMAGDDYAKHVRQIITGDSGTSRCIMWQSKAILAEPKLEYRVKGSSEGQLVSAEDTSFEDDGRKNIQYSARLDGLRPGESYEYRIVNGDEAGGWHKLSTDSGESFKALIFPDSQSADYSGWEELAKAAAKRNPEAVFFVNMGDIVDNGEDFSQWQAWLYGVEGIIEDIPFVPVMGNHETYNRDWKVRLPEAYLGFFEVPGNGSESFGRYYYSFDYGDVHFVVLNTQWDETEEFKPGLMEAQLEWFRKDVEASHRKWKVVFLHKDVLQYRIHKRPERKEGFSQVGEHFMPLFDELGIDIVFTAHLHTYRDRGHIRDFQRDERGPLYILTGVAGDVRYPGLWVDHALDEVIAPQPETANYLTLEAAKNSLTVRCFLPEGREIDKVTVNK